MEREYHPECRCDPRRPLMPDEFHTRECPAWPGPKNPVGLLEKGETPRQARNRINGFRKD